MTIFDRIFRVRTLNRWISFVLKECDCFVTIPEPPKRVLKSYHRLTRYKDSELIPLFEKADQERLLHNLNIDFLVKKVEQRNQIREEYVHNPDSFPDNKIRTLKSALLFAENHQPIPDQYSLGLEDLIRIFRSFSDIKLQFEHLKELKDLLLQYKGGYISEKDKEIKFDVLKPNKNDAVYYPLLSSESIDVTIEAGNQQYMSQKAELSLFDDVLGSKLDQWQREAIVKEEVSNLVVAGAGSGKTTTICGRVMYLLRTQNVDKNDILLLSYSKSSVEDLRRKIDKIEKGMAVSTFHSLGLDILAETKKEKQNVEEQFDEIIETFFREEAFKNINLSSKILRYYSQYLVNDQKRHFHDEGEAFQAMKNENYTTLKEEFEHTTLKKERVKSFQELGIANYYFMHGIKYEYEAPYEKKTSTRIKRQYNPDFYLPDYHLYHEHFGINREGEVHWLDPEGERKYLQTMDWKRRQIKSDGCDCIETYSYEFSEGTVYEKLENELLKRGVAFKPLSPEDIDKCLKSIYRGRSFSSFISLIKSFLNLYKAQFRNSSHFETMRRRSFASEYDKCRSLLFLDICQAAYDYYYARLKRENKIDFDDMILGAVDHLDQTSLFKYKYIIVDEFQDISLSRYRFLEKLIEHGGSRLFAVGDDWQAIYRFAGCDLNIFLRFDEMFHYSSFSFISNTHRTSAELQTIIEPFITANPEQIKKSIHSDKHVSDPVVIIRFEEDKFKAFEKALQMITDQDPNGKVYVLGRNNRDFESVLSPGVSIDYKTGRIRCRGFEKLEINYKTVHSSKGLENDYVILVSADDDKYGFPNKMEDDPILSMVLSGKSDFEFSEERRLFYVALTRALKRTYILTKRSAESSFVREIESKCELIDDGDPTPLQEAHIKCPYCGSGHLVLRETKSGDHFYGCSNYPMCSYRIFDLEAVKKKHHCPVCGDFLVERKGANSSFYGCNSYPSCEYTEQNRRR